MNQLSTKGKACKYSEVDEHGGMFKVVEFESKAKEREVQNLHEDCKYRERQDENELQVFKF